jgi:hypothetical protein
VTDCVNVPLRTRDHNKISNVLENVNITLSVAVQTIKLTINNNIVYKLYMWNLSFNPVINSCVPTQNSTLAWVVVYSPSDNILVCLSEMIFPAGAGLHVIHSETYSAIKKKKKNIQSYESKILWINSRYVHYYRYYNNINTTLLYYNNMKTVVVNVRQRSDTAASCTIYTVKT